MLKLLRPSQSNLLFDGASLVLYMCGITVYSTNIVKGFRLAADGKYGDDLVVVPEDRGNILGREESLKVYAASNTILGLVLVGILVLQSGQWYAERKNAQEEEETRNAAAKKTSTTTATGGGGGSTEGKKKSDSNSEVLTTGVTNGASAVSSGLSTASGGDGSGTVESRLTRSAARSKNAA